MCYSVLFCTASNLISGNFRKDDSSMQSRLMCCYLKSAWHFRLSMRREILWFLFFIIWKELLSQGSFSKGKFNTSLNSKNWKYRSLCKREEKDSLTDIERSKEITLHSTEKHKVNQESRGRGQSQGQSCTFQKKFLFCCTKLPTFSGLKHILCTQKSLF